MFLELFGVLVIFVQLGHTVIDVLSITRHHHGDIYSLVTGTECECGSGGGVAVSVPTEKCQCQCPHNRPSYRDDLLTCVDNIKECPLAEFVTSSASEKIPYVMMPNSGQLVHPTAQVVMLGLEREKGPLLSPVCVVTEGRLLTSTGWIHMANTSSSEPPFRLFRDSSRTYVQWVGEESLKASAEGRIILVPLVCKDSAHPQRPLFHPCVAFRVAGTPGKAEVAFSSKDNMGLTTGESVIIGLVVGCLLVVYFIGTLICCRVRRKRRRNRLELAERGKISRRRHASRSRSRNSSRRNAVHARPGHNKPSLVSSEDESDQENIVDLSGSSRTSQMKQKSFTFTTAVIHDRAESPYGIIRTPYDRPDGIERAHVTSVSVVETNDPEMGFNNRRLNSSLYGSGEGNTESHLPNGKRKLYFSPMYFEPRLLQAPPPAAIEFLTRIREMITLAKLRMKSNAYQPSLVDIPEDDYNIQQMSSRQPSTATNRSTIRSTTTVDDNQCNSENHNVRLTKMTIKSEVGMHCNEKAADVGEVSSTLKRLATRISTNGNSVVNEIVKNLDLKPKFPICQSMHGNMAQPKRPSSKPPPPPIPINERTAIIASPKTEENVPELIKPSMLKSMIRDGHKLNELKNNSTFENFRQEMMITFSKMRRVGEALSPKNTLTRLKNRHSTGNSIIEKSSTSKDDKKVQQWLTTLDNNNYGSTRTEPTKPTELQPEQTYNEDVPPPLPVKMNKQLEAAKRTRMTGRSISFNEVKDQLGNLSTGNMVENGTVDSSRKSCQVVGKTGAQISRSYSWKNDHRHYDIHPRKSCRPVPVLPEGDSNAFVVFDNDSLNDLLSAAESKVPKMVASDAESVNSDSKSQYKDSLEFPKNVHSRKSKTQMLTCDKITADIYDISTEITAHNNRPTNGNVPREDIYQNTQDGGNFCEHTYEEIKVPTKADVLNKSERHLKKVANEQFYYNRQENYRDSDDNIYSIYSNPDSLVNQVMTPVNENTIYSKGKISIVVEDNNGCAKDESPCFDQDTLEKCTSKVQRNNSIVQDSLERPKVKARNLENHENSADRKCGQIPSSNYKKTVNNNSLLSIYESRNNIGNKRDSFPKVHTSAINPVSESKSFSVGCGNGLTGALKTFKDYKEVNAFGKQNAPFSKPLHNSGTDINLHFCNNGTSDSIEILSEERPPLPPKNSRSFRETDTCQLPVNEMKGYRPPLPAKSTERKAKHAEADAIESKSSRNLEKLCKADSTESIPELTEAEAQSILHGLLAHVMPDPHRLSPLHEDEEIHFLAEGNTADDSNSFDSVPTKSTKRSSLTSTSYSPSSLKSAESDKVKDGQTKKMSMENDINEFNENFTKILELPERVNGEFILSHANGKSIPLKRQKSVTREQKTMFCDFLEQLKKFDCESSSLSSEIETIPVMKVKAELENYFKEKSDADAIKKTWQHLLEFVDGTKNSRISLLQLQRYLAMSQLTGDVACPQKQEDSGYQSTDSSDSGNSKASSPVGHFPNRDLTDSKHLSRSCSSSSFQRGDAGAFQRSSSLQNIHPKCLQAEGTEAMASFQRASLRASLWRRQFFEDPSNPMSVYINNQFGSDNDTSNVH